MSPRLPAASVLALWAGLAVDLPATAEGAEPQCPRCRAPTDTGRVSIGDLGELSGLAASLVHPGVVYAHNDSGDKARFFALDLTGKELGRFRLRNAENVDWEDAARGPCGAESCLFFGDIGDNKRERKTYAIYRVREPAVIDGQKDKVEADELAFRYPDGAHDAETLLVHPKTGAIWVVTKVKHGPAGVYELPQPFTPGPVATLVKVGEVHPASGANKITGGAVHPDGTAVLLRTYSDVWFFPIVAGETVPQALQRPGCQLPVSEDEQQGEAVTWLDSQHYLTASEGRHPILHEVLCLLGSR